jgi:hypothetical protein
MSGDQTISQLASRSLGIIRMDVYDSRYTRSLFFTAWKVSSLVDSNTHHSPRDP